MAKQLEPKVLKHQQHLKLQKEAEEELWISGEELRTDGSSDEESQKNYKALKKIKKRKSSSSSLEKKESATSSLKPEVKEDHISADEENATAISVTWRPKRGSLKLPDLYEGVFDDKKTDFFISEKIYGKHDLVKCLPMLNTQEVENISNYNVELTALMRSISQLEGLFLKNMSFLEDEKSERLKIEEEMCSEISKDDRLNDRNGSLFLKLCNYENLKNREDNNDKGQIENGDHPKKLSKNSNKDKNFIQRNIELAALAMSKLPLTDEEKQRLEEILSDIDLTNTEDNNNGESSLPENMNENENKNLQNAFHLSEVEQQRLDEIDLELKNNFTETQNLRFSNNDNEENFWKSLVLDQMLKDIDEKLAELKEEDTELKEEDTTEEC